MAQDEKKTPSISPGPPSLADKLKLAVKDEALRRGFRVTMKIHGGVRGQNYTFDFSAGGDGAAHCRYNCGLSGRKGESERSSVPDKDFASLLGKLQKTMQLPHEQPKFLPDTVVGVLEVSDGENVRRFYFAADPEQAKTQGKPPPAELLAAVNAVYAIGAQLTGSKSVKP